MDGQTANEVYDVLARTCGAPDGKYDRENFVLHQTGDSPPREWRFIGRLGFGGKFWNCNGKFYVTCYREDETPERRAMIDEANALLAPIYARTVNAR